MSMIEDSLEAYEKYAEVGCFGYFIQTVCELTSESEDWKVCWMTEKAWKIAITIEKVLFSKPYEIQLRFLKAAQLVLKKKEEEVENSPNLKGLAESLPAMQVFVKHISTVIQPKTE